jgi:hypothetical protein
MANKQEQRFEERNCSRQAFNIDEISLYWKKIGLRTLSIVQNSNSPVQFIIEEGLVTGC